MYAPSLWVAAKAEAREGTMAKPKEICEGCGELAVCETRQVTFMHYANNQPQRGYTIAFYCAGCAEIADEPFLLARMRMRGRMDTEFRAVQKMARR